MSTLSERMAATYAAYAAAHLAAADTPEWLGRFLQVGDTADLRSEVDRELAEIGRWPIQVRVVPKAFSAPKRTHWLTMDPAWPWTTVGRCQGQIERLRKHGDRQRMILQIRYAPKEAR